MKLGDLGLSKRAEATAGSTTVRATPGFVPPEILGFSTGQDPKRADPFPADMWCLAETIFQALTNRGTFDTYGTLMRYVVGGVGFPIDALAEVKMSDQGIEFIQHLMAPSPLDRPSPEEAIKHTWIMIEDDHKSDDGDSQYIEEEFAVPAQDALEEITQPDIHWTTDLDTAEVQALPQIQIGPDGQDSEAMGQRPLSPYQEALTEIDAQTNPERSYVLVSDCHEDDSRSEGPRSTTSSWSTDSTSSWRRVFEEIREELFGQDPVYRWIQCASNPFEEPEDPQSPEDSEDEIEGNIYVGKTMTSISAEVLSKRVLSELACRYHLPEKVGPFDFRLLGILMMLTREGQPHLFLPQGCERRRSQRLGCTFSTQAHDEPTLQKSVS